LNALPAPDSPLLLTSATELAGLMRRRDVSVTEVLTAHLKRIEDVNSEINAIVTLNADCARAQARELDRRFAANEPAGPLAGLPFTVKDVIATKALRTTAGTTLLSDYVPESGATAIERLQAADAILLGKSNCPEFALDHHTSNVIFGDTWNPVDTELTSGGSSGGDSAAVASGCAAFGIGTDYGGSIRWPAHCTGTASLRPTPGRIPGTGMLPYACGIEYAPPNSVSLQWRLQVIAPIARTANDLKVLVEVMAGPDDCDPYATPVDELLPPVSAHSLRIAWWDEGVGHVRRDLQNAVASAAAALADAGLVVERARPEALHCAESVFHQLRAADGLHDHVALIDGRESEVTAVIREWLADRVDMTVAEYRRLAMQGDRLRSQALSFMRDWPILLLPVASIPAFRPGVRDFDVHGVKVPWIKTLACCRAISLLALPAGVVRFGTSDEGLPIGVQVVGRPFHEHEVLAVMALLEECWARVSGHLGHPTVETRT
jgi:Asp-tRNA(Asn)/Glu-tRNA(Gln) amidotransferase A subunit family amidase